MSSSKSSDAPGHTVDSLAGTVQSTAAVEAASLTDVILCGIATNKRSSAPPHDVDDVESSTERRVRARHLVTVDNSLAGDSCAVGYSGGQADEHAASSSASATASVSSSSPPYLYRHALESIFSFFDLHEIVTSLRVCREWRATVRSMRSLELEIEFDYFVSLRAISISDISRHIGNMWGQIWSHQIRGRTCVVVDSVIDCARFPRLHSLTCNLSYDGEEPVVFPPTLTDLFISINPDSDERADVVQRGALQAISRLPLLHTLTLCCPKSDESFACLSACPSLRVFALGEFDVLSDQNVSDLRALHQLEEFQMPDWDIDTLENLLAVPHQLQWRRIFFLEESPICEEVATLLSQLPLLDTLSDDPLEISRIDFLHTMPNLTSLNLFLDAELNNSPEEVVDALASCRLVRQLAITGRCRLTDAHLIDLLPRFSALSNLQLTSVPLASLSFLAQSPMVHQLTTLCIDFETSWGTTEEALPLMPLSELRYIPELRCLDYLALNECFSESEVDDQWSLDQFRVPSLLMPHLQTFKHSF